MSSLQTRPEALEALAEMVRSAIKASLTPPPDMSLPEWADEYRRLSQSSGAIGGRWDTSRVEVARGPMLAVKEPGVRIITVKSCTQLMKTSLLENVLGYHIHLDPCPILLVQPKDEAAEQFSKERLSPMVKATPVLKSILDPRSRRTGDTVRFKKFPGGFLAMSSAGSPTNLAMRAIRIALLDEIDKYETTKEGDPVALAEERMATYGANRLSIRVCSPTWEETSRINRSYQESDQRRAYVACPHCGHEQYLDFFKHVQWENHDANTAAIYCEACGCAWAEGERQRIMTTEGEVRWYQTRPFICCGEKQDPKADRIWEWDEEYGVGRACCRICGDHALPSRHAGFTASKLYAPHLTMVDLAAHWLRVQGDPEGKQTFYNTQLGEAFKVEALRDVSGLGLMNRREVYDSDVPEGVVVITAGVDVHPGGTSSEGRLEYELVGWGIGEESWSLEYGAITGDPARQEVWDRLDEVLLKRRIRADGVAMTVRAACIDSGGHNTQEVYRYAQSRLGRNVWAIKGSNDRTNWSPIWPAVTKDRRRKVGTQHRPILIGVSAAKEAVRQRLLIQQPGPGYCHFPHHYVDDYFDQLTAERLVIEQKNGSMVRRWVKPSNRSNEAFDCRVYAYAALWGLYHVRRIKLERVARELSAFHTTQSELEQTPLQEAKHYEEPYPVHSNPAYPPRRRKVRKSNWMS